MDMLILKSGESSILIFNKEGVLEVHRRGCLREWRLLFCSWRGWDSRMGKNGGKRRKLVNTEKDFLLDQTLVRFL
jgi:hypothetical protein